MRGTLVGLLLAAGALSAQVRLDSIESLASKATESVNLTLSKPLLEMIANMAAAGGKDKDAEALRALVAGLNSISVRQFEFGRGGQYRQREDLEPIRAQLTTAAGWNKIVSVVEPNETSEIYTRVEQDRVVGLTIIAAEPSELTVVTIDGTIDLATLAQMGGSLGIPDIGSIMPKMAPKQNPKGKKK